MTEQQYLIDQVSEDFEKPPVRLVGKDGNVFSIIGRVKRVLENAGRDDLAKEFVSRAMSQHSYGAVLMLVSDYCDVDPDKDEE